MAGEGTNSRLTSVQIRLQNNQFTEEIPISVLASNIIYDPGGGNVSGGVNQGYSLVETLGNVNMNPLTDGGSLQSQIDSLRSELNSHSDTLNDIPNTIRTWLSQNCTFDNSNSAITGLDTRLLTAGLAADAKAAGDLIKINNSLPTEQSNKIWIKPSANSVSVPTMLDIENIIASLYENIPYNIGDYVIHNDLLYKCIVEITTGEAWTPAHWTAISLGEEVTEINSAITESVSEVTNIKNNYIKNLAALNSINLVKAYGDLKDITIGGVTFTWDEAKEVCTITGKRTSAAYNTIFLASNGGMQGCFVPGKTYYFTVNSSYIDKVYARLYFTFSNKDAEQLNLKQNSGTFTIPNDAIGITLRIQCDIATSVSNISETISFKILNVPSNQDLEHNLNVLTETINGLDTTLTNFLRTETGIGNLYFTSWSVQVDGNNKFSLLDMPQNSVAYTLFNNINSNEINNFPYENLTAIYIEKIGRGSFNLYRIWSNNTNKIIIGYYTSNGFHWYALPRLLDITDVNNKVETITRSETGISLEKYFTSWSVQLDGNNKFSLLDMPQNTITYTLFDYLLDTEIINFPYSDFNEIIIEKIGQNNSNFYKIYENNSERFVIGFYSSNTFYWYGHPNIHNIRIGMLGDSVTKGVVGTTGTTTTKGIPYWVNYETGLPVDNLGIGSMGWISKQYLSTNAEEYIKTIDLSKYDVLTLQYGLNDGQIPLGTYEDTTQETIMGTVYRIIDYIYTQNPTIQVIIINPTVGSKTNDFPYFNPNLHHSASDGWTFTEYFTQMKLFSEKYSIPLIDGYKGLNAWNRLTLIGGNVHPTEAGYRILGRYIAGQIKSFI